MGVSLGDGERIAKASAKSSTELTSRIGSARCGIGRTTASSPAGCGVGRGVNTRDTSQGNPTSGTASPSKISPAAAVTRKTSVERKPRIILVTAFIGMDPFWSSFDG